MTLKPTIEISHAVMVVPILAPMMTPMDSVNDSSPAFTKLTTNTVVADEDCTKLVMVKPVNTPLNRLEVMELRMLRIFAPATFCMPSLMTFMP